MTAANRQHRCWVEVSLGALERNIGRVRSALPERIRYIAVVKADAYGHGMAPTVARLMQAGVHAFAVANVYEAAELREIGSGWPVLVLGATLPEETPYLIDYDLVATLSTHEELSRFERLGRQRGKPLRVHLKVDTGMGRLGVWHTQAGELFEKAARSRYISLEGIFTHFSSAVDDPDYTRRQRDRLLKVIRSAGSDALGAMMIHADNSTSLETFQDDSPFNAVRIGLLQFGLMPYRYSLLEGIKPEPILSFHTRIGLVKSLPKGVPVSYGQTHRLKRKSRIAVLTAGYGDGIPTACSNRGEVLIRGKRCPILGRVTMDQTVVDVTEVPEVEVGDLVTLIGMQKANHIDVEAFSKHGNTIVWETFCSITKRVPRCYTA